MTKAQSIFAALREAGLYNLRGDVMIVEEVPRPEVTTKAGLVLGTSQKSLEGYAADKPLFVRVLQIGDGWIDDNGKAHPVDFEVGDILLVGPLATVRFFADILGVVSNISGCRVGIMQGVSEHSYMTFKSEEDYQKAYQVVEANK